MFKLFADLDPVWGALFGLVSVVISVGGSWWMRRKERHERIHRSHDNIDQRETEDQRQSEKALRNDLLEYARTLHEDFNNMREELKRTEERAEKAEEGMRQAKARADGAEEKLAKACERISDLEKRLGYDAQSN